MPQRSPILPDDAVAVVEHRSASRAYGEAGVTHEQWARSVLTEAYPLLIAASGPSHWGVVAVGLRAVEATHDRYWRACSQGEHHCRHGYIACENPGALLPLADQIIQDLAEPSNGLVD